MSEARVVHVDDKVPGAVYIGRAAPRRGLKASPFKNPHKITPTMPRREAVILYEQHLTKTPELWARLPSLRGKPLACWCRHDGELRTPETVCHGDVLVHLLRHHTDDELFSLAEERGGDAN